MATIYKIWSEKGEKVYIGSTTQPLHRRMITHTSSKRCMSNRLFKEYGIDSCKIEAIEEVKVDECCQRERYWIEFYKEKAVNCKIPGRTKKEWEDQNVHRRKEMNTKWLNDNAEYIKEYNSNFRATEERKQYLKIWNRTKINCPHCEKEMCRGSLSLHLKRKHPLAEVSVEEN